MTISVFDRNEVDRVLLGWVLVWSSALTVTVADHGTGDCLAMDASADSPRNGAGAKKTQHSTNPGSDRHDCHGDRRAEVQ